MICVTVAAADVCRSCSGTQGLGFPEIAVSKVPPPFVRAVEEGLLDEPVFSFWMNRQVRLFGCWVGGKG